MKKKDARGKARDRQVILLGDLAPRTDVKGGAGKLLFGEHLAPPRSEEIVERTDRVTDRPAKRGAAQQ